MPAPADAPAAMSSAPIMGVTVGDMDESLKFWQDQLGWTSPATRRSRSPAMLDLMGLPAGSGYRTLSGVVPGSRARIEIIEFKGMPRKPFDLRVPDPGASGMAIRVADIEGLLPKLKREGVRVVSKDGELVLWSATLRNVFVKDPDGLNIELVGEPSALEARLACCRVLLGGVGSSTSPRPWWTAVLGGTSRSRSGLPRNVRGAGTECRDAIGTVSQTSISCSFVPRSGTASLRSPACGRDWLHARVIRQTTTS